MRRFLIVFLAFLVCSPLFADRVVFKSGKVLEGKIIRQTRTKITIKLGNDVRTIPKAQIRRVYFSKDITPEQEAEEKRRLAALQAEQEKKEKEAGEKKAAVEKKALEEAAAKAEAEEKRNAARQKTDLAGALWRSALLPGWGQYYQGRTWPGVTYGGLFLGAIGGVVATSNGLSAAQTDLDSAALGVFITVGGGGILSVQSTGERVSQSTLAAQFITIENRNAAAARVQSAQTDLNIASGILATVYLLNLADVYFNAPDSGTGFQMHVSPEASQFSYTLRF